MKRLILASASPRRKELLKQVGAVFEVCPAKGEERITKDNPKEAVMELAGQKAEEVAGRIMDTEDTIILGADTVVAFSGVILGKPKDKKDAERMLAMLNGKSHSVYTGVAVIVLKEGNRELYNFYEETKVFMYPMTDLQIHAYVESGEPMDKAGAYAIQGRCAVYIKKIIGDYNNVVGLPVARIYQEMKKKGIEIFSEK